MTSPSPLLNDVYYHIYNRGTNRENIFIEERNFAYFLQLYARHIEPVAETYAYCLLRNHFHALVHIRSEVEIQNNLSEAKNLKAGSRDPSKKFSDFFNAYAKTINKAYGRTGSLFQHPFGRVAITSDQQFWRVIAYIHQNPQKHGFVSDFREWKYSSYGTILTDKPTHLAREAVLDWFGGINQYLQLHAQWVEGLWIGEDEGI